MSQKYISTNSEMQIENVRAGMSKRIPKHDKAVLGIKEWRYEPGVTAEAHAHTTEATMHYIAQGKARVRVGEEEQTVEAGCYYYTPRGVPHAVLEVFEPTIEIIVAIPQPQGSSEEAHDHGHEHGHGHEHAHDHEHPHK